MPLLPLSYFQIGFNIKVEEDIVKSASLVLIGSLVCVVLSCTSYPSLVDRGVYNPNSAAENDLVSVGIDKYVSVVELDSVSVKWLNRPAGGPVDSIAAQTVRIPAGVHVFDLDYNDGNRFTFVPTKVIAKLETNKTYRATATIEGSKVKFDLVEEVSKLSAVLDMSKLRGNRPDAISAYIRAVLNPTMDEVGHIVRLENESTTIVFGADMTFFMTDKVTGTTTEGRAGFVTDFAMVSGKTYLLQADNSKMTRQQFLDSNYQDESQIVLVPVECDGKMVRYRYERPAELKDTEVIFQISEMAK